MFRQPLPLRGFDEECRRFIADQYTQSGLKLHTESQPQEVRGGEWRLARHLILMRSARDVNWENVLLSVQLLACLQVRKQPDGRLTVVVKKASGAVEEIKDNDVVMMATGITYGKEPT